MDILLKLKNWQLFFISFLLPFIIVIIKLSSVNLDNYESEEFNDFLGPIAFIYYVILFIWNYRVTKTFNRYEKALTKKQLELLDWLLTILIIYVLYNIFHKYLGISHYKVTEVLFMIFSFTSVFAFFYVIFCTAKTLKYIQFKNQLRVPDIIVEMFLILYFPIGVWWLQKKVNKYYNDFKRHSSNQVGS
jgi:hypothetical protein